MNLPVQRSTAAPGAAAASATAAQTGAPQGGSLSNIGKALRETSGAAMTGDDLVEDMNAFAATQARKNAAEGARIGARAAAHAAASNRQTEAQNEAAMRRVFAAKQRLKQDAAEYADAWTNGPVPKQGREAAQSIVEANPAQAVRRRRAGP